MTRRLLPIESCQECRYKSYDKEYKPICHITKKGLVVLYIDERGIPHCQGIPDHCPLAKEEDHET